MIPARIPVSAMGLFPRVEATMMLLPEAEGPYSFVVSIVKVAMLPSMEISTFCVVTERAD
ncbi:MAG: hypothetical protein ACTSRL_10050 [Candidatus Helarchaeota archaeon]